MRFIALAALVVGSSVVGFAQQGTPPGNAASPTLAFEAASIKLNAGPPFIRSGFLPGGRYSITARVSQLLATAYPDVDRELIGAPDWVNRDSYDVIATAGRDATRAEMQEMIKALLIGALPAAGARRNARAAGLQPRPRPRGRPPRSRYPAQHARLRPGRRAAPRRRDAARAEWLVRLRIREHGWLCGGSRGTPDPRDVHGRQRGIARQTRGLPRGTRRPHHHRPHRPDRPVRLHVALCLRRPAGWRRRSLDLHGGAGTAWPQAATIRRATAGAGHRSHRTAKRELSAGPW